jgi:hypothetical protein
MELVVGLLWENNVVRRVLLLCMDRMGWIGRAKVGRVVIGSTSGEAERLVVRASTLYVVYDLSMKWDA